MSSDRAAIFIFTRDRPEVLVKTLSSVSQSGYPIYLLDDSVMEANQIENKLLSGEDHYLGKEKFQEFTMTYQADRYTFLLREPGNPDWNLGYMRNFALLFAISLGLKQVLFMDDDIVVPYPILIDELFIATTKYPFTGAFIAGMIDDSILGHIASDLGVFNERMLSGGFMAFNPDHVDHFFLNNYNEDWIWLFLHLQGRDYLQKGEVFQVASDPLANYQERVLFQEYGELALDGILDLFKEENFSDLCSQGFWERMVHERDDYLKALLSKAQFAEQTEIIQYVLARPFDAIIFRELFEKYFADLRVFKSFLPTLF
jgi:hypothetical protein